jgi:hypothetical protein
MEYTDWNQNLDIDKIILDMENNHINRLSQNAFEAIIIKIGINEEKSMRLREIF